MIFNIKTTLLLIFTFAASQNIFAQSKTINLDDALEIARLSYAGLQRDRLSIDQQQKLAETGVQQQLTQVYLTGEEFDFATQSGIHSLNVQQNFYLPKASNIQKEYYKRGAAVAEKRLALTDRELKRQVSQAYYHLLYAKKEKALVAKSMELYNDFLAVTTTQLESGETGKIPQLAARSRLGQAKLEQQHAEEIYLTARTLFNQWLQSGANYDIEGDLEEKKNVYAKPVSSDNPHLQVLQAQRELAIAKIETEKIALQPQINTGLKLQMVSGDIPFFGYQIGVNLPLFKKSTQGRIDAAEIGVKVEDAALKTKEQNLKRKVSEIRYQIEHQVHVIKYLRDDLTPIVNEQRDVNFKAYREGEISYLEYLDGLEQVILVRHQYLMALYEWNVLRVELEYWIGV